MLRPRPNTFTYYRLFFVLVILLVGIAGVTASAGEFTGLLSLYQPATGGDREAFMVGTGISGVVGLIYGCMLLYLISDRRRSRGDRRQCQMDIDFPDRRSGVDRRAVAHACEPETQWQDSVQYHL